MAFDSAELSVLAYANGFTLWHYRTADRDTDLVPAGPGNGYFAAANELLRPGDQIIANLLREGRPVVVNLMVSKVDETGIVAVEPIDSGAFPAPVRHSAAA
jgi:hypothetical protein